MKIVQYIKESFVELNTHVTWLSWSEAQRQTVLVAIFTVIFALAVYFVDQVFTRSLTGFFNLI
jgi:preprotein translocase subunit SecE